MLLVIACPCALVLATPVTVVSGLAAAARRGILIKGGVYLEEARKLRVIALDKTGTITEGKPRLVATELLPSTVPDPQVLAWAASLAGHSDHPVSKAIATGLKLPENGLTDFVALAGRGIEARTDGQLLFLGNHRLIEERKPVQCRNRGSPSGARDARPDGHHAGVGTAGAGDFCGGGHHQGKLTGGGGRTAPSRCRLGHADRRQCGDGREHRQGGRHRRRSGQSSPRGQTGGHRRFADVAMARPR